MSFLSGLFGGGGGSNRNNANMQSMLAMIGQQNALSALGPQYQAGLKDIEGRNFYDPYSNMGENSLSMLGNSLGLGGAAGNEAARNAFQAGPGYQFELQQGLEGVNRDASSRGLLGSGNTMMALNDYGRGMANREFGNWQARLGGLSQMGLSAAGGQQNRQQFNAGFKYGYGRDQANIIQRATEQAMRSQQDGFDRDRQDQQAGMGNLFNIGGGLLNLGTRFLFPRV
jgi:hypothetical protein